jgi:hypothetical protein
MLTLFWLGKPERKRPHGRLRHGWNDNIRMDHREIKWEVVDWMLLTQGRDLWWAVVNMVMNFWLPRKAGNFMTS